MNFVTFYTLGNRYEQVVQKLLESAEKHDIEVYAEGVEDRGTWVANCGIKPEFIRKCYDMFDEPFTFVDADAQFHGQPVLLDELDCDIAVHYMRKELLSGTVYVGNTEGALEVLDAWVAEQKKAHRDWDQRTLQRVLERLDVNVTELPQQYTAIFDRDIENRIIVHYQESRKGRRGTEGMMAKPVDEPSTPINILHTRAEIESMIQTNCNRNPGVRVHSNGTLSICRPSEKVTTYLKKHYRQVHEGNEKIWAPIDSTST